MLAIIVPTSQNQFYTLGRDIWVGHAIRWQVWRHARQNGGGRVEAAKREIVRARAGFGIALQGLRRLVMERAERRRGAAVVARLDGDDGACRGRTRAHSLRQTAY